MKPILPKRSKRGITLVEVVIATLVLAMFATGVLTLLTAGQAKITETAHQASCHGAATQMLDAVIAALANGGDCLVPDDATGCPLPDVERLNALLDPESGAELAQLEAFPVLHNPGGGYHPENLRGWYLRLGYDGITVTGFAANSQGVFDQ